MAIVNFNIHFTNEFFVGNTILHFIVLDIYIWCKEGEKINVLFFVVKAPALMFNLVYIDTPSHSMFSTLHLHNIGIVWSIW